MFQQNGCLGKDGKQMIAFTRDTHLLYPSPSLCLYHPEMSLFLWKTKATTQDANASPRSPTAASMKFRSFRSACQAYQYQISAGQIVS